MKEYVKGPRGRIRAMRAPSLPSLATGRRQEHAGMDGGVSGGEMDEHQP